MIKKILIAGAGSYIGESVKMYLESYPEEYSVDVLDTRGLKPTASVFSSYDVVFCVAGIAHIKETKQNRHLYYEINRDLVISIAKAAKAAGVKQFVLLSSMSVYGLETGFISKKTPPKPVSAYGKSKLQADQAIKKMENERFKFACLRPPMVYGENCTGNYRSLRSLALKSPVFPKYSNQRSMIYIGNLCEFIKRVIDQEKSGLFFPQNKVYTDTSEMVKTIAVANGKQIKLSGVMNFLIRFEKPGIIRKVFGNLTYEPIDTVEKYKFKESIFRTEANWK